MNEKELREKLRQLYMSRDRLFRGWVRCSLNEAGNDAMESMIDALDAEITKIQHELTGMELLESM